VTDWTTAARVKSYLGLGAADTGDDAAIDDAVAAVNAWLDGYAPTVGGLYAAVVDPEPIPPLPGVPTPAASYGATTLAARLFTTRNSPMGVASFSDLGGTTYVSRYLDVQTQQLLNLGRYTPGRVG
jgi:hypothetical protein